MNSTDTILYIFVFLFSFIATALITRLIIPFLKKRAEQPIYTEGPSWHISKSGTPTMGGISFLIAVVSALLLSSFYKYLSGDNESAVSILLCALYALANALIGITDDMTKLKHKRNAGLSPRAKLILQFAASAVFLTVRKLLIGEKTELAFSFGTFEIGIFYYFISLIILVGITNCANLTDGIDGLASSVAFAVGISAFYLSYRSSASVGFISSAIIGATIGFLCFNAHPAKIFMGDTGSLFLGALIASVAFELKNPFIAVLLGGVYVIEGISVILQVVYFKATKKRLFKMAPIHHHLEKCGWDENKICICAIVLTLLFCIPLLLLIRL